MDAHDAPRMKASYRCVRADPGPPHRPGWRIDGPPLIGRRSFVSAGTALVSLLGVNGGGVAASGGSSFDGGLGIVELKPSRRAPAVPLFRLDRSVTNLAKFRGKVVLINFWASWCAPCVIELPALERLSIAMANEPVEIAAVSIDREGAAIVEPFVRRLGLDSLRVYLDPAEHVGHLAIDNPNGAAFALYRTPISYLIDRLGMIRGYVPGAVQWDTDAAKRLLRYYASA